MSERKRGSKLAERSEALARREGERERAKRAPRRLPSRRGGNFRRGSKPAERSEALARQGNRALARRGK